MQYHSRVVKESKKKGGGGPIWGELKHTTYKRREGGKKIMLGAYG